MVLAHGIVQSEIGVGHITRLTNLDLSSYTIMSGKQSNSDISLALIEIPNKEEPIMIFEGFPFCRHNWMDCGVEDQLVSCREEGKSIICSIRDIVIPWAPEAEKRIQETIYYLNEYFDLVLVHSDPNFCRLEDSFPHVEMIDVPIEYTGYVTQPWDYKLEKRQGTLVSSGMNGKTCNDVFEYALKDTTLPKPLKFCIGKETDYNMTKLHNHQTFYAPSEINYRNMLSKCQMAVNQCGYNTFTDIVVTKTPVHWIPFVDEFDSWDQKKRVDLWNSKSIRNINLNGITNTAKILSNFT